MGGGTGVAAGHRIEERKFDPKDKNKVYVTTLWWQASEGEKSVHSLPPSDTVDKKKLQRLLREMARKLNYRNFDEPVSEPFLIVEEESEKDHNYRIESVAPVDLGSSDPTLDLGFFIDASAYAHLLIYLRPDCRRKFYVPPPEPILPTTDSSLPTVGGKHDLSMALMDEESWVSFKPDQVMFMIDDAMIYGLENDCCTEIHWDIKYEGH